MVDMAKFLFKKDLILSLITKYDDNPCLYLTWKPTFKSVMESLSATLSKELDMLHRYIENDSSKQASTIRKCNADNPMNAIKVVLERLEEGFGAPELVESSLLRQISTFTKIRKTTLRSCGLSEAIASVKRQPQYASLWIF
jgi:hypothetical protein